MSEDNIETKEIETPNDETSSVDVNTLQEELKHQKELIKNLRKYEKSYKEEQERILKEQDKYKELYEGSINQVNELKQSLTNLKLDSVLTNVIKDSGAKNVNIIQRLIDKSNVITEDGEIDIKSIQKQINSLQKEDPSLFGLNEKDTPEIKKTSSADPVSSMEIEIKKAKTTKELEDILKRYNR